MHVFPLEKLYKLSSILWSERASIWPYNQLRFSCLLEELELLSHDSSLDRKKQICTVPCTSCSVACNNIEPTKNTFVPRRMISYTVSFKLNVMKYVKEHSNRTTKEHFGVHQPQKWCMENKRGRIKDAHWKMCLT